jgi:hypothetical protein
MNSTGEANSFNQLNNKEEKKRIMMSADKTINIKLKKRF